MTQLRSVGARCVYLHAVDEGREHTGLADLIGGSAKRLRSRMMKSALGCTDFRRERDVAHSLLQQVRISMRAAYTGELPQCGTRRAGAHRAAAAVLRQATFYHSRQRTVVPAKSAGGGESQLTPADGAGALTVLGKRPVKLVSYSGPLAEPSAPDAAMVMV